MPPALREYRHTAAASRHHGLPAIGFRFQTQGGVEVAAAVPQQPGDPVVRVVERGADGRVVGELTIGVFAAALIIDRDGILEEHAEQAAMHERAAPAAGREVSALPIELAGGPSGYRVELELTRDAAGARPALPCVAVLAVAPPDLGVNAALAIVVRSADPEWPTAADVLGSLRFDTRGGAVNDQSFALPVIGRRR